MKVPVSWLRQYVEFDDSIEGLAEKLTFSGAEVEGIETVGGGFEGLVVGEIKAVEPHPNADRLSLCTVDDGNEELQVVCGAPNCAVGGKHPFAPVGTVLQGEFKIKKAKLRGIESFGMLCAEDELGISEDHEGIVELDDSAVPGTPLAELMGPPETVIDLEITPNRPDCLSMIGIAREVAAIYGSEVKIPSVDFAETATPVEELAQVEVLDSAACPRYTARAMTDVEIKPAPEWMRKRLELAGVRSINNIVDISNYVMLECGQPLHAFDHDRLAEGRIVVRPAREDEVINTLDDEERDLEADMLVIADVDQAVAVAGVMGGATSEIGDGTTSVLLESAYFDPAGVRTTSKKLGLTSESSYRFARGVDCGGVEWASRRAAALLAEYADAEVAMGVIDIYPAPIEATRVSCSTRSISALLGIDIATGELADCFESLGLEVIESDNDGCRVGIPSFRSDLRREVDLAEEYARIYGLDNIPAAAPRAQVVPDACDRRDQALTACRDMLIGLGLRETMNYSLLSPELLDTFAIEDPGERIVLPHPISADQSVLRSSLIPQMVESLGRNHSRQIKRAAFFELGRVFRKGDAGASAEEERISIGLMGTVGKTGLERFKPATEEEMFIWIKGLIGNLILRQAACEAKFEPSGNAALIPGLALDVSIDGNAVGVCGVLRETIGSQWRIQEPLALAELRIDPLIDSGGGIRRYSEISTQPAIERDMALVARDGLKHAEILEVIEANAPAELESVALFDIFTGKGIPEGHKSMAYALSYRADDRTLTDEQANHFHERIKSAVRKALDVELRG